MFRLLGGPCTRLTALMKPHEAKEDDEQPGEERQSAVGVENPEAMTIP